MKAQEKLSSSFCLTVLCPRSHRRMVIQQLEMMFGDKSLSHSFFSALNYFLCLGKKSRMQFTTGSSFLNKYLMKWRVYTEEYVAILESAQGEIDFIVGSNKHLQINGSLLTGHQSVNKSFAALLRYFHLRNAKGGPYFSAHRH